MSEDNLKTDKITEAYTLLPVKTAYVPKLENAKEIIRRIAKAKKVSKKEPEANNLRPSSSLDRKEALRFLTPKFMKCYNNRKGTEKHKSNSSANDLDAFIKESMVKILKLKQTKKDRLEKIFNSTEKERCEFLAESNKFMEQIKTKLSPDIDPSKITKLDKMTKIDKLTKIIESPKVVNDKHTRSSVHLHNTRIPIER